MGQRLLLAVALTAVEALAVQVEQEQLLEVLLGAVTAVTAERELVVNGVLAAVLVATLEMAGKAETALTAGRRLVLAAVAAAGVFVEEVGVELVCLGRGLMVLLTAADQAAATKVQTKAALLVAALGKDAAVLVARSVLSGPVQPVSSLLRMLEHHK